MMKESFIQVADPRPRSVARMIRWMRRRTAAGTFVPVAAMCSCDACEKICVADR